MPRHWKKPIASPKETRDQTPTGNQNEGLGYDPGTKEAKAKPFASTEESLLLKYLKTYRFEVERIFLGASDSQEDPAASATHLEPGHMMIGSELMIGEIRFPTLTRAALSQPYVALPKELTSKQRRCVHELCIDVDLYHCSVGLSRDDRFVAISMYCDGFEYLPTPPTPTVGSPIPIAHCRPWYLRVTNPDEKTKQRLQPVYQLFDQPSQCLRDDVDVLDFQKLENESLADIQPPSHDDNWMLVDSAEKMKQCAEELLEADTSEIGFDMEMYNPSKYVQVTCLLQLTSNLGKEYVIDTLAPGVWDLVSLLAPLFSDPNIVKIGHCIGGMDIKSLHLDFGIFVVNAFDTFEAASVMRLDGKGLATVCQIYGLVDSKAYAELKENHQRMDWRKRPLSESMIRYGRCDVHYLIKLRRLMLRDLTRRELWDLDPNTKTAEDHMVASSVQSMQAMWRQFEEDEHFDHPPETSAGPNESALLAVSSSTSNEDGYATALDDTEEDESSLDRPTQFGAGDLRLQVNLMTVLSKSQQNCLLVWGRKEESPFKNATFLSVVSRARRGETDWTISNMKLYEELFQWRNTIAEKFSAHPGLVCPLDLLARFAEKRPTCEALIRRISFHLPDLLEGPDNLYVSQVISMVRASVQQDGLDPDNTTVLAYKAPPALEDKAPPVAPHGSSERLSLQTALVVTGSIAAVVWIAVVRWKRRQ